MSSTSCDVEVIAGGCHDDDDSDDDNDVDESDCNDDDDDGCVYCGGICMFTKLFKKLSYCFTLHYNQLFSAATCTLQKLQLHSQSNFSLNVVADYREARVV